MAKKGILSDFMNTDVKEISFDNHIQNIRYTKIKESEKNRKLRRIEELAEDIAEDGLEDNLVVRKIEDIDYEYELVAGHRRYNAILHNIQNGDMTYEYIPCKVEVLSDLDARKRLILNNYQNDPLTPAEKLDAIEELRDIYRTKKANGEKIPGRIQTLIADEIGLKKSQVANYEKILNNATAEVRECIDNERMTIETAVDVVSLDPEKQKQFIEEAEAKELTKEDLKIFKANQLSFNEKDEIIEIDINDVIKEFDEINDSCDYDKLDEYDDTDEYYEETSLHCPNITETNNHKTIEDSLTCIVNELDYLKEKICGVEFKEESKYVDNICRDIDELLMLLGLECDI